MTAMSSGAAGVVVDTGRAGGSGPLFSRRVQRLGKAAQAAARTPRERLASFAAAKWGGAPDAVRFSDGQVAVNGRSLPFAELAAPADGRGDGLLGLGDGLLRLGLRGGDGLLAQQRKDARDQEKQQGHNAERQRARQPDIEHEPERQEQEDQPEEADEGRTGEHAGTLPGDLDATGDLGLGQSDVVVDERGDVARRVGDELADRALILDRGASHGHTLAGQGDGTIW